ncbi:MipA/OmpV family protein [Herbaspirillum sp. SJZ099]|uniref:MipA/OmpV family protein n=1 Tax=Herbaspirillum sp. SJZ099 TaxID=2572916 RepID=UPI0011AE1731|nr:MipA/OmpV family protein [Herbaspirillum sp. SJZ099]TWC71598.1 outer membrane protein [Herbaspirillum sp. SJZ099]
MPALPFRLSLLSGVVAALMLQAAHAQESAPSPAPSPASSQQDPQATQWALGAAVGTEQSPYRGYGNKTRALPLVMYNSRYFQFIGTTADFKLGALGPVGFALRAKYADDGYDGSDAPILNGMEKRKGSFWLGAHAAWRNPYADLSLEWLADASGNSGGQTLKLRAEHQFKAGSFTLAPYLGINWMSSDYVDYYFGVRQNEATAQRAAYQGSSTANLVGGLRTGYSLTPSQSLFLDVHVTRYGSGITDSPLVDRSSAAGVRAGYLYRF